MKHLRLQPLDKNAVYYFKQVSETSLTPILQFNLEIRGCWFISVKSNLKDLLKNLKKSL